MRISLYSATQSFNEWITPPHPKGCPFNLYLIISSAVASVNASLVFGKRFDYEDADFQNLLHLSAESALLAGSPLVQLYDTFPSLMKHFKGPYTTILTNYSKILGFLKKQIEKHKKDWDPFKHSDLTDVYIGEMDKRRKKRRCCLHYEQSGSLYSGPD
ncbi:hypothetical protein AOLI_G00268000 [Acnodon oligacanthus]